MNLFKYLAAYLPLELPTGMTELNKWLDDIIELVGPIADRDSIMFVAGHECVSLPNTKNRISKINVVRRIKKYAYNQCMAKILMEINNRHIAAKTSATQTSADTTTSTTSNAAQTQEPIV